MRKIDFYYWGDQCPHNSKMRQLLNFFLLDQRCTINLFDISKDHRVAEDLNIFSPNMLVIDNKIRWHGPISKDNFESILNGIIPKATPYTVKMSKNIINGDIKDLRSETIIDTCMLCSSSKETIYCNEKGNWIKDIMDSSNLIHLGKLHYLNQVCVGGAEFVPSMIVPYPIPKAEDLAFLTCSFTSSEDGDYRSYPLLELERELPKLGFKYNEERHSAKMHLIKKDLTTSKIE